MRFPLLLAAVAMLSGCSAVDSVKDTFLGTGPQPGQPGFVTGFLGGVVADEPRATLAGREVLSGGGNAADAMTAMVFTETVTLPSRASLGGGGACMAYWPSVKAPGGGNPEAVMFLPLAPASPGNGDRPAAVPMMARGLYLLHARYGSRQFETLVAPVEQLARFGVPASRALAQDISVAAGPLLADPGARAVFAPDGKPLVEGQMLRQPDLGGTLAQLRQFGVGELYQGALAHKIADVSPMIGGPISYADIRGALPKLMTPLLGSYGNDKVAFLPPPADGGLATLAAFETLSRHPDDLAGANARALAVAAKFRAGGVSWDAVLADKNLPAGNLPQLPASTSLVAMDRDGNVVACSLTMDNLFGTGRILPGTGILAAASPAAMTRPLLSAAVVWNSNIHAFRAAAAGSGQQGAPVAVAQTLVDTLRSGRPMGERLPAEPGRANMAACAEYLPGKPGMCGWANDLRLPGLAIGAN